MNLIGENDELTVDNKKWNEFRRVMKFTGQFAS